MLETGPMAVATDRLRRVIKVEIDVAGSLLLNPALKCAVARLIIAGVNAALARPALLLPIRHLAALDGDCGGVPPHRPRENVADGSGGRPCADFPYTHSASAPTSALVEAKIFSPSLTLS